MGGDRHGSKSGRYVGGFMQLFDWNAKSRKKLFSSRSDSPEESKQGKKGEERLPVTRIRVEEDEEFAFGAGLSVRGGSDYSCASSVTDDDGFGTKAPGVVARLMGLDSLPTSMSMESYSTPYFDSISLREAPFRGRNLDFYQDHQIMHSGHLFGKMEAPPTTRYNNELETRSLKLPNNRPFEKFQTDTLPPKSTKTIPITHHKLLSPIKSPIFVPSQDAAHIMEAAAKIIEPGPSSTPRAKISSAGSSSVSFKVREMREKLEAAQRPLKVSESSHRQVESSAAKYLKGQPMNKSWNGLVETPSFSRASPSREDSSASVKKKGKSISLAIQAKVNVQKREGLTSSSRSLGESEEQDDNKSTQSSRNQSSGVKFPNRKSSVLRQNNQKQNCHPHRERSGSTSKKAFSEDTRQKSLARDVGTSRTSSRKSSLHARDNDKGVPYDGVRNVPRKKRSIDGGNLHFNNKNQVTEKPSQSSVVADNNKLSWIEESRRKGMDVVSFTFTAPITRSQFTSPDHSRQLVEKGSNIFSDDGSKMLSDSDLKSFSSPGLSGIKGDALSKLLEQKLKELTSSLENSNCTFVETGTTVESAVLPGSAESATRKAREKMSQQEPLVIDIDNQNCSDFFANEAEQFKRKFSFQAGEAMEKYSSCNKAESKKWNDFHLPSPVSNLEPSIFTESCCSSESIESSITEESKQCSSSVQAQQVIGSSSLQKSREADTEISDSASSTSSQITTEKYSMKTTAWELGYVKDILCNAELMFKDYVAGRTREIVNPHLFDQMERRRGGKDESQLERKMLFDCVSECLDLKCQRFIGGGFEMWRKGIATLKRKERLAEEVYKEIQEWRNLGNSMVDELVDKDMSSKYGRWLDFEVDEFMLGVDIEDQILDSLVEEIVSDFLFTGVSIQEHYGMYN
ncbi:hypothetical protein SOVF_069500 [Spinacia oleracea]|uniref:DUF4378 domain-containing protein n=1 Tax=Spinacia oleracea TaxID=3562 RepID=A0A9R0HW32_SPIOL|nr:uncharacterized protein LOC110777725 [Spinacia oleracea]KNA18545.1 hypothetical protein SOVF_069500 [Spinacia oleracea]